LWAGYWTLDKTIRMMIRMVRLCVVAAMVVLAAVGVAALDPPPPYAPVNPGSAAPAYPNAKTITICASGCDYTQPRLAFPIAGGNRLAAGDTLEIRPGTYNDPVMSCMYIVFDDITVVGVLDANGNRPKLSGLCGGKAAVVTGAKRLKVSNLELTGVTCSDGNCAGVRHDSAGGEVTLTNLWIHDNQNGLLASSKDDVITIVDCLFENNGFNAPGGMAHNLYIGASAAVYFRNSISRNAKLGGHEFKSRAYYSEIESSIIAGLDGVDSRNIDIPDGGTLVVRNSIIEKGANSMNTDMINYAAESWNSAGTYVRQNAIFMSNNIGISDRSKSTFLLIMYNRDPTTHEIKGHTLVNLEKLYDGSTSLLVTGTLLKTTRSDAGFPAYPTLPDVPAPGTAGVPPDNSGPTAPTSPTATLDTPPSPPVATNPGSPAPAYPNAKKITMCASGCQYTSLYDAHVAAAAGDTIEVSGTGPYGCLSIEKNDLTLTGVLDSNGNRPKLTTTCGRKGVLVTIGKRITIKNLELYGAACDDGNCAGIRHDAAGGGLTLINVYSHDNQNGILASATNDIVTIQDCLFESNGYNDGRGMAHNLYMARHAAVYFRNSISRRAMLGGHEFKSRAYYTEIESSYLVSLDGVDSRMVDVPEGGIVVIRNSVLASGARTSNQDMVGWAAENFDTRQHELYAQNNIVIGDKPGSPIFIQVYSARFPTKSQIANNKFVKIGTIVDDGNAGKLKEVGSWVYLTRAAANYGAYPYYPPLPTSTPTNPTTPTYSWKQGGFNVCTQTCGGGTQTQSVTCVQDGTTTVVTDSYCTGTKPLTSQSCNTQACPVTYSWVASGFTACTVTCGGGIQTQTVTCVQDGTRTTVDSSNCANSGTKPLTQQTCNTQSCGMPTTFSWKQNGFGVCTVTCGGGTQTQTVVCVRDGTTTTVADTNCDAASKPVTQKTCNTQACSTPATFSWVAGGFTACTVTCGGGTQTQKVTCVQDGTHTTVDESNCVASTKPRTLLPCNTQSCPSSETSTGPAGPSAQSPTPNGPAQGLTIKVARDLITEVAKSTYTSEFIVQTSQVIGIPQRRVQVVSLTPGSTIIKFLLLPPYSDETGASASISAADAANLFIDDWTKDKSTLRAQSSMADGEQSQGLQANTVTQCGDMSYTCDPSQVNGNDGGSSKSVTSESWFIAVIVILIIVVVGLVAFGLFKYHTKQSAPLKSLASSTYGIADPYNSSVTGSGDVQMHSQSQSTQQMPQVQPISQPEMLFAARPAPPPVPSNRPPPMPRREVPINLA